MRNNKKKLDPRKEQSRQFMKQGLVKSLGKSRGMTSVGKKVVAKSASGNALTPEHVEKLSEGISSSIITFINGMQFDKSIYDIDDNLMNDIKSVITEKMSLKKFIGDKVRMKISMNNNPGSVVPNMTPSNLGGSMKEPIMNMAKNFSSNSMKNTMPRQRNNIGKPGGKIGPLTAHDKKVANHRKASGRKSLTEMNKKEIPPHIQSRINNKNHNSSKHNIVKSKDSILRDKNIKGVKRKKPDSNFKQYRVDSKIQGRKRPKE